ncbi:protein DpdG [Chloroflexota bacterium]
MSVFNTPEAIPSRLAGVFKYLLSCENLTENIERLEKIIAPVNLQPDPGSGTMFNTVISESNKMKMTNVKGKSGEEKVFLNKDTLPVSMLDRSFDLDVFRLFLGRLIMDTTNDANHDLCNLLAWFLAQDVFTIVGDQIGLESTLRDQVGEARLGLTNDARFGNFVYWAKFLGFALETYNFKKRSTQLIPDPSKYIVCQIKDLFSNEGRDEIPLSRLLNKLSELCPIIEGGFFHNEIEKWLPDKEPDQLYSPISFALLKLEREGIIKLSSLSDAPVKVLMDGKMPKRVSHINLVSR